MKCFNHPEIDAVGICKSCARGICRECVSEVGTGIACRNRCEADVAALNKLVARGRTAYQRTSSTLLRTAIFLLLLGEVFLILGINSSIGSRPNYFLIIMGALFFVWGVLSFISARRIRKP
jgi:hypothetical protein